jgi:hypothetical protein
MKKAEIKAVQDALTAATTRQDGTSLVTLSPSTLKALEAAMEEEAARKGIDRDEPPRAVAVAVHRFRLKAEAVAAAEVVASQARNAAQSAAEALQAAQAAARLAQAEMYEVMRQTR